MGKMLRIVSGATAVAGLAIGLVCAPFMFSADIVDVTGAGLGCVTGAILMVGGLLSLCRLTDH